MSFGQGVTSDCLPDKGVLFVRVEIADGRLLNIFHTHLQASYSVEEAQQGLPNFYVRIKQTLLMRNYINQKMAAYGQNRELSLLVGDLNIDANLIDYPAACMEEFLKPDHFFANNGLHNEYDLFMAMFNERSLTFSTVDLFFRYSGRHPITYGDGVAGPDGVEVAADEMLTHPVDFLSKQSLDYILMLEPRARQCLPTLGVDANSLRVQKFNQNIGKLTQLSDHYGLSCTLVFAPLKGPSRLLSQPSPDFLSF